MRKKRKTLLWIVAGVLLLLFVATFIASTVLENKIKERVARQLPSHLQLSPYELSVSVMSGSLEIKNIELSLKNATPDSLPEQFIAVDKILVSGVNYFKLLFTDEIKIKEITLEKPIIQLGKTNEFQFDSKNNSDKNLIPSFSVERFAVKGIDVILYEKDTLPYLQITQGNFTFHEIELDEQSLNSKIPFRYKSYDIQTKNFSVWLNPYDLLTTSAITLNDGQLSIQDFYIKTQHSKEVLSTIIQKERDYVDLFIPEIKADGFDLNQQQDSLWVHIDTLHFTAPKAEIYRDKLVADDLSEKPLYSKSLRFLPFLLSVHRTILEKATVTYEEKIHDDSPAGQIFFSDMQAEISDLGNVYNRENHTTKIKVNTTFMNTTSTDVTWEFDVLNPEDSFVFRAKLGTLEAEALNHFVKPNLKIALEGVLNEIYFTIDANHTKSNINMLLKYEDFKVEILNSKNKKNTILSAAVNLFVKKKSAKDEKGFTEGNATVERNIDKSVFNYLWINIEAGLKNAVLKV